MIEEKLMSQRCRDGRWHAHYPTATQTLCGQPIRPRKLATRRLLPDCGSCGKIARAFHRIDGSMPDAWLPGAVAPFRVMAGRPEFPGLPVGPVPGYGATQQDVIDALHAWASLYGQPPSARDWNLKPGPGWPSCDMLVRKFGTWNAAMVAAGFTPRPFGRPKRAAA